jgi:KDO2-lipid IV(A) lauroyltransferase
MGSNAQKIMESRKAVNLALWFGRVVPERLGYAVVNSIVRIIARQTQWDAIRAARANQWVVSHGALSPEQLDQRVLDTFRFTGRAIFELNHNIHRPEAVDRLIRFDSRAEEAINHEPVHGAGSLIVSTHLGNFDFCARAAALRGLKGIVITLPEIKNGGYQLQYEMRREIGLEVLPASRNVLRQAIQRLRAGELVLTGIDRPIQNAKNKPRFFGRPADLPMHHIYLALKAAVPISVAVAVLKPDNRYHFLISDPIRMRPDPDHKTEMVDNAERVLRVAEGFIRQYPEQWSMYFPVWPDAMAEV